MYPGCHFRGNGTVHCSRFTFSSVLSVLAATKLASMVGDAPQLSKAAALMHEIRILGRLPKEIKGTSPAQTAERNLAKRLNRSRAAGRLTTEHEAELAKMMERQFGNLSEAKSPPDPLELFASEASNRLEQDLFIVAHSIRPRPLLRRLARYKRYVNEPCLQQTSLVLQFKGRVNAAAAVDLWLPQYVLGMAIRGDALREFSSTPLLCGPFRCNESNASRATFKHSIVHSAQRAFCRGQGDC